MERDFLSLEDQIRRLAGARPVRIAVTEWNTTAGDWELGRAALQTLGNALSVARYHNLMHRHADSVEIAIRSNLIDSFGSGVILTGPGWLYVAPAYHAQCLYARAAGSFPVRVERHVHESGAPLPWNLDEPDLSATLSADGRTLRVYGVNATAQRLEVKAELAGWKTRVGKGTMHVVREAERSGTPEILNSRDEPERVKVFSQPAAWKGATGVFSFEPFSVTLYELQ